MVRKQESELVERFGPMRFAFELPADKEGLQLKMRRWSILHAPMPLWLAPRSGAVESGENDLFHFDVSIALPFIGKIVHYRGTLQPI